MTNQQREREPHTSLVLYRLLKWSVISPVFYTYFRGRVYGVENVPKKGPLIIVSNHASYVDPPILSISLRRPVAYMAKEELFEVPLLKQTIRLYGAYPVKRGAGDRAAMRAGMMALQQGWIVGLFLQGTRTHDGRIDEPKLGAALIAAKAQVPLLPASIWGTDKILPKGASFPQSVPVTIRIGELIETPRSTKRDNLQETTQKCVEIIHALHNLGR